MLVLGLVTGGIFATFLFSRRVSYRTEAEMMAQDMAHQVAEQIRLAVGGQPGGLPLTPGVWLDPSYDEIPTTPVGDPPPAGTSCAGVPVTRVGSFPDANGFMTNVPAGCPAVPANLKSQYNLRWRYYVEDDVTRVEPPCPPAPGSAPRGKNWDGGAVDLNWIRIVVDWDPNLRAQ